MKTTHVRDVCVLLCVAILAFSVGCGTAQSPRRQVDDAAISARIKAKLASDVSLSSVTNIDVNTTNGVVTLAGQVESEDVRHRAEQIAGGVEGVVSVSNNLQVETVGIR